ncbi:hypothetical protein H4Q26_002447 [Puccinia striiformis f. sp. tritici PST-130]|nr:hypothetical protein H4Q26_002447 [Puccinia striiformis f. sp. tritici PST-130]
MDRAKRQRFHEECGAKLGRAHSEHGLPIFPAEADRVQKSRQPEIAPIAPSPPTQIKKNTLPNITNTQIMAENCAKCRKSSDAPLFAGWCQKCVRSMRGPSTSGLNKHQTSLQETSSSSTSRPAPSKRSTSASTSRTETASIEHFRSAVTAKRKKPNADPYPKKKPTQTPSKDGKSLKAVKAPSAAEAKFSPSPNMRFIECGLTIYRGRKCAGEPLTFNKAKTFIDTLPRHPKECLSLVRGKSRLPDLQALTFVIHKSTEKKPVQIDLVYHHPCEESDDKIDDNSPSDSTQVASKKAACKRGATQQSRGSSPDMITEVPTKKAASSRPKPRKVASQHLPDDFSSDSIKVHTTKQASARQKRQRVPSDHETTESDEIESWGKRAEMEPDAWALGGIAGTFPARGETSLSRMIQHLGRSLPTSIDINTDGWINAFRLVFKTQEVDPTYDASSREQFSWLEAHALPIILRVAHE